MTMPFVTLLVNNLVALLIVETKLIFEQYCLNQNLLMNQDYRAKIDDLVRSTQREAAQTSFTTVILCESLHAARETPGDAKTMDEVQNETSVAKMTQVE
jgi:hypothetical protein